MVGKLKRLIAPFLLRLTRYFSAVLLSADDAPDIGTGCALRAVCWRDYLSIATIKEIAAITSAQSAIQFAHRDPLPPDVLAPFAPRLIPPPCAQPNLAQGPSMGANTLLTRSSL
jgi:hypothetical protein